MTELAKLLKSSNVFNALIIDDSYDPIPVSSDLIIDNEEWTHLFDDINEKDKTILKTIFPQYENIHASDLRDSDEFVRALWNNKNEISKALLDPLFNRYELDTETDLRLLNALASQLKSVGLNCDTSGRDFKEKAASANLIFIDLFLGSGQSVEDIELSINGLKEVIAKKPAEPPLVVLMSRSPRMQHKREEFRERANLFESNFRILTKIDIQNTGIINRLLTRLALHYTDSLKLAVFLDAWQTGLLNARDNTSRLIRKLGLSDLAQIHQLLLSVEGEPTGTYLVDVFDKVLQHEVENNIPVIKAAIALNELSSDNYPPPHVPGSKNLQELVYRSLFQNSKRLLLPGTKDSRIAFGDLLKRKPPAETVIDKENKNKELLGEIAPDNVLVVLSPACDLQRNGAKRVLLLVGELKPLTSSDWTYKDDGAKTPVIDLGLEKKYWIKWDVKHIETLSQPELELMLSEENGSFEQFARLRESHALELQQKLLANLGRVGLTAPMPATFHMAIEIYLPDTTANLFQLNIQGIQTGGVCFVGRQKDPNKQEERLILSEDVCEAICNEIYNIDLTKVHQRSHQTIIDLRTTGDLLQVLEKGIPLPGPQSDAYKNILADNDKIIGVVTRRKIKTTLLASKHLPTCGIVLSAFDPTEVLKEQEVTEEAILKIVETGKIAP